jgi:hypothetical protein
MASRMIEMPMGPEKESARLELLRNAPLNSWVALSADESHVIAIGHTFIEADARAKASGEQGYVLTRTPDAWMSRALLPFS